MYYRIIISKGADRVVNELPEALKTFRQDFDVRVFVDRNKGDWHMPMEWHTSLEIFICIAGRGKYQIGEKRYTFETGDVFVINNGELHKSEIIADMAFAGTEQTVQSRR